MAYINTQTNQYPISESQIRAENPQISYPKPFQPGEPYAWVFPSPIPTHNPITQIVREGLPVNNQQVWEVVDLDAEQVAANQVAYLANLKEEILFNTQKRLDEFARTRGYDSILSACTYATSPSPVFSSEGQYCVNMRDSTWVTLYTVLSEVEGNVRPVPSGYADVEALLPPLEWPA